MYVRGFLFMHQFSFLDLFVKRMIVVVLHCFGKVGARDPNSLPCKVGFVNAVEGSRSLVRLCWNIGHHVCDCGTFVCGRGCSKFVVASMTRSSLAFQWVTCACIGGIVQKSI